MVPIALPPSAGIPSAPWTFREHRGVFFGGAARIRINGTLGLVGGLSATLSERSTNYESMTSCQSCESVLLGGRLGLSARRNISPNVRLEGGIDGELIHLGGEAYSQPMRGIGLRGVEPTKRLVGGTGFSIGSAFRPVFGGALRLNARARRYSVTSRWTDPEYSSVNGQVRSTPYTDLLVSMGWTFP